VTISQFLPKAPQGIDVFLRSVNTQLAPTATYPAVPTYVAANTAPRMLIRGGSSLHIMLRWEDFCPPASKAGTATVTAGSTAVTGVLSKWSTHAVRNGDRLYRASDDAFVGTVSSVASDLALTLTSGAAVALTGQAYYIVLLWDASSGAVPTYHADTFIVRTGMAKWLIDCVTAAEHVAGRATGDTPIIVELTTRIPPWAMVDSVTGVGIAQSSGKRTNTLGWQILSNRPDNDAWNTYLTGISTDSHYTTARNVVMQAWSDSLEAGDPNAARIPFHYVAGPGMNSRGMRPPEGITTFPGTTDGSPQFGTTPDTYGFGWTAQGHHQAWINSATAQGGMAAFQKRASNFMISNGQSSGGNTAITNTSQQYVADHGAGPVCPQGASRLFYTYESFAVCHAGPATNASASLITNQAGDGTHNEVQTLTVSNALTGTYTLTFSGQTTAALAYNATATQIQTALRALSNIAGANVNVTGAGPFTITFVGTLALTNVAQITANTATLYPNATSTSSGVGKWWLTYWNQQSSGTGAWYVHAKQFHAYEIHTRWNVDQGPECFLNIDQGRPSGQELREFLLFRPATHSSVPSDWYESNSPPYANTLFYTVYVTDIDHPWDDLGDHVYYANLDTALTAHAFDTSLWVNQYYNPEPAGTAPTPQPTVVTPTRRRHRR
jgi:hypothetical protein